MAINPITFGMQSIKPLETPGLTKASHGESKTSFTKMFSDAIHEVESMQKEADKQIEGAVLNKEGVTTHGAMLALEKADIAFQLMTTIRSKIIRAYEDVIRTQV